MGMSKYFIEVGYTSSRVHIDIDDLDAAKQAVGDIYAAIMNGDPAFRCGNKIIRLTDFLYLNLYERSDGSKPTHTLIP